MLLVWQRYCTFNATVHPISRLDLSSSLPLFIHVLAKQQVVAAVLHQRPLSLSALLWSPRRQAWPWNSTCSGSVLRFLLPSWPIAHSHSFVPLFFFFLLLLSPGRKNPLLSTMRPAPLPPVTPGSYGVVNPFEAREYEASQSSRPSTVAGSSDSSGVRTTVSPL